MEDEDIEFTYRCVNSKSIYKVRKAPGGFGFWRVEKEIGGPVPKELSGRFTTHIVALNSLKKYDENQRITQALKNDLLAQEREERKNGTVKGKEGSKYLREGANH